VLAEDGLSTWYEAFRRLQGREVWRTHGDWLTAVKPNIGPGIAERLHWTSTLTEQDEAAAAQVRDGMTRRMAALLAPGVVMVAPVAPGIAPRRGLDAGDLEEFRHRVLTLTCVASLAGLPQVAMPLAKVDGCPVALSLIGGRGEDEMLLDLARRIGG
jgi:amidase